MFSRLAKSNQFLQAHTVWVVKLLGVPSNSILSRDPDLSRKPPETQGKRRSVFEKNDGWKEWGTNP